MLECGDGIDQSTIKEHPATALFGDRSIRQRQLHCLARKCNTINPRQCMTAAIQFPSHDAAPRFLNHRVTTQPQRIEKRGFASARASRDDDKPVHGISSAADRSENEKADSSLPHPQTKRYLREPRLAQNDETLAEVRTSLGRGKIDEVSSKLIPYFAFNSDFSMGVRGLVRAWRSGGQPKRVFSGWDPGAGTLGGTSL